MKKILFIFMLAPLLFIAGCKKKCHDSHNPDCVNYAPCWEGPVSAEFDSYAVINYSTYTYLRSEEKLNDTVAPNTQIRFEAKEKNADKYTWIIGADTFHTVTASRYFQVPEKVTIPIILIVEKKPNKSCFPNDNGKDTIAHNIYFTPDNSGLFIGKFFGCFDGNPKDTATVVIDFKQKSPCGDYLFMTTHSRCVPCYIDGYNYGYRNIVYNYKVYTCSNHKEADIQGRAAISFDNRNELKLTYQASNLSTDPPVYDNYSFVGYRVP